MKRASESFCWFCNETVKSCEHKTIEQKRINKFLNWLNYGGNGKTFEPKVVDNHYTPYGRGYNQAISDVYTRLTKTLKIKGLID